MTQTQQPTDEQIIQALRAKQHEWSQANWHDIEGMWTFNHVHTVLHHAIKIFKTPVEQLNKETFRDKTNA